MSKAAYNARLILTGATVAMTDEAMSDSGDGLKFDIDDATKDIFDPASTFVVEIDSGSGFAAVATSAYAINYLLGQVIFTSSQSGNDVQITGNFLPKFTAAQARSASIDLTRSLAESSVFGDSAVRRTGIRLDSSWDFEQLALGDDPLDGSGGTENSLLDLIRDAVETVIEIQPDRSTANALIRAFVRVSQESVSIPNDDLVLGSVTAAGSWRTPAMTSQIGQSWSYKT